MRDKPVQTNVDHENEAAYSRLYKHYANTLYNYGRKFSNDSDLIKDCIQEVFLDFWTKKEKLQAAENQAAYFFSSFRYLLLRKIKQSQKNIYTEAQLEKEIDFSIGNYLMNKEEEDQLHQKMNNALKTLTARQREAVFLRFYQGLSYEQIATVLHITVKASYKIMARSLEALRNALTTFWPILYFMLIHYL